MKRSAAADNLLLLALLPQTHPPHIVWRRTSCHLAFEGDCGAFEDPGEVGLPSHQSNNGGVVHLQCVDQVGVEVEKSPGVFFLQRQRGKEERKPHRLPGKHGRTCKNLFSDSFSRGVTQKMFQHVDIDVIDGATY